MGGGLDGIGEGVLVESGKEALQGCMQRRFETTDRNDGAGVRFEVETFDHVEVGFAGFDDIADANLVRLGCEGDPAFTPKSDGYEVVVGQSFNDTDQVIFGDAEGVTDLAGVYAAVGEVSEVEQDAKRVIRVEGEMHPALSLAGWSGGGKGVTVNIAARHAGEEETLLELCDDLRVSTDEAAPAVKLRLIFEDAVGERAVRM